MKLARTLTVVGLGVGALGYFAVAQGCSSSTTPTTTLSSVGQPPARPDSAAVTSSTTRHTFALKTLLLGDTDRNLAGSTTAWKKYGFNIDGKVSAKDATDVCKPAKGASKDAQVDGESGIDNSFGSRIVPIIQTFSHDISKTLSDNIQAGGFTIMIDTVGLTDDAKQTNTGLTGQLFTGGKFDKPTFTTADKWPVTETLLVGKDVASGSKVKFTDAYITNGTWVNGAASDVSLSLSFSGVALDVTIHRATIVFDHVGALANNGTIGGVINTEELITGLQKVAGRISESLCGGSAFDSIAQQIRQASDILSDGSNSNDKSCDAISIGIGFTAAEISAPSIVSDLGPPQADKCGDAGADPVVDSGSAKDAASE